MTVKRRGSRSCRRRELLLVRFFGHELTSRHIDAGNVSIACRAIRSLREDDRAVSRCPEGECLSTSRAERPRVLRGPNWLLSLDSNQQPFG